MTKMNTEFALKLLADGGNQSFDGCLYMEVGQYKPWSMPVIGALKRRGYRVDKIGQQTFLLYPKTSQV
jgi:hypothetical protein